MEKVEEVKEVKEVKEEVKPKKFAPAIKSGPEVPRSAFAKSNARPVINLVETNNTNNTNNARKAQIEYNEKMAMQLATGSLPVTNLNPANAANAVTAAAKPAAKSKSKVAL